jgi:hypothetical protein
MEKMMDRHTAVATLALLACISIGCNYQAGPDCIIPPCALPMAIMVRVTSTLGGPVPGLTLTFSGAASGSGQCGVGESVTSCVVPGLPGTYNLQLAAPGFQEKALSVTVQGSTPQCGCTSVQIQQLDVDLTPR